MANILEKGQLIVGKKFGRLTVLHFYFKLNSKNKKVGYCFCACDCGNFKSTLYYSLKAPFIVSCGCAKSESLKSRWEELRESGQRQVYKKGNKKYKVYKSAELSTWHNMITRCYKPYSNRYYRYGARGILVCDRWKNSFQAFFEDMGTRPSKNYSIERMNNDGNYEPNNCKWATRKEQIMNRSVSKK